MRVNLPLRGTQTVGCILLRMWMSHYCAPCARYVPPVSRIKVSRRNRFEMTVRCTDCHENWRELPDWQ